MAARDLANFTVVRTGHRVVVALRGVVSYSDIVGRLELTVGAVPGTLGTGGGVLVQVHTHSSCGDSKPLAGERFV